MIRKKPIKYVLAPQTKFYDSMGANWKPFVMFNHFSNIRSKFCNTDIFGLRFNNLEDNKSKISIFDEKINIQKKRAVLIGNSTAFGEGASCDQKTISSFLSQMSDYHFFNFCGRGFSGYQEINNFLLLADKINNLEKIIIVSGLNDSYLPYYVKDFDDTQAPIFGYNTFLKAMKNSSRGWKNKLFKIFFGKFFAEGINWSKVNSLNWHNELFKKKKLNAVKKKLTLEEQLINITDRNFLIWSIIANGMKIKIDFMLQPVGSWCQKKLSTEEEKLFREENNSKELQKIYQHVDKSKYELYKDILKKSAEKNNINFLDCNDIFNEKRFDKEWLFLNRFHLTDLANKYIAELLVKKVF